MEAPRVSVIIPTLNEASTIGPCLDSLADQGAEEIIVADAESPDGTASLASRAGAIVVNSPRGRGVQQNRGAAESSGDVLLFLHADCRLEPGAITCLRRFIARNPNVPGGCFKMRVDAPELAYRAIDAAAHLRAGVLGLPYGDQGIFICVWSFGIVGGFPEIPLMEDLFLAFKLRSIGRLVVLPKRIIVSPRRWRNHGILGQSFRNWTLTAGAAAGVGVDRLARFYPVIR